MLVLGVAIAHPVSAVRVYPISAIDSQHDSDRVAANLLDGNPDTIWDTYPFTPPQYAQFDLGVGNASAIDSYVYSASSGTNPYTAWTFYGSNDTTNWDVLDSQAGQSVVNYNSVQYNFTNTRPYRYVRFTGTAVVHNEPIIGDMYFYTSNVTLGTPPEANFTKNATIGVQNLPVAFVDTSITSITEWNWSFGNGNYSTTQSPIYTYYTLGNHSVTLTVTNASGTNVSATQYVEVLEQIPPNAGFTTNVSIGLQNLPVAFTDTSNFTITAWNWSFGNGNYSTTQNPTYTYYTLGNHTVTLLVTNATGTNSTERYVEVLPRIPPVAAFSSNVSDGYAPLAVGFTSLSFDSITGYNWTFGSVPGNYSAAANPSFNFTQIGTVPVTLLVTNASSYNQTTQYLTISKYPDPPLAMFTPADNRTVLWPAGIKLTSASTNYPTNCSWNWGDGVTTYGNVSSKHIYAFPGIYYINLTASNVAGTSYNDTYVQVII